MGFLALIPAKAWEILAVVLALASFGGYMYYRGGVGPRAELSTVKAQFEAFQGQVKVVGEQAQKAADARKKADQLAKETANHENAAAHAADAAVIAKLRHNLAVSTHGNYVPSATVAASRPDLACFDRASLESAVGEFISGIRGLADEGAAATVDLNTAKKWAQKLNYSMGPPSP